MNGKKLLEEIRENELGAVVSRQTGNDTSGRFLATLLKITKTRDLVLYWRKSKDIESVLVGCFRLFPENLIEMGYCRKENGKVRIILYHREDGWIWLCQGQHDANALRLGQVAVGQLVGDLSFRRDGKS